MDITGTSGPDELFGTGGGDTIEGLGGDDLLRGRAADDLLDGGTGADLLRGRGGDDTYLVDDPGDRVAERIGEGIDTVRAYVGYHLQREIENLELWGHARRGEGNALDNRIVAMNDGLIDNVLDGGVGADFMSGGLGDDTYYVDNLGDTIEDRDEFFQFGSPRRGIDTVVASIDYVLPGDVDPRPSNGPDANDAYIENLALAGSALIGTGNNQRNTIIGNAEDNVLSGVGGADTLFGMDGDDRLEGGAAFDVLEGGAGDDILVGGSSPDSFRFDSFDDDVIEDFTPDDDVIELYLRVFAALDGSLDGRNFLLSDAFVTGTASVDEGDRIIYDPSTGKIFYDPDGTGAAGQISFVTVAPGLSLTNLDFHIV